MIMDWTGTVRRRPLIAPFELSRLAVTRRLLRFAYLFGCHSLGSDVAVFHHIGIARPRAKVEPHVGANGVLRDTSTLGIHRVSPKQSLPKAHKHLVGTDR